MRLNPFHKPPPPRKRRRKISHKWVDQAKSEVNKMPSLANLEEDIVVKAAILSTAGHYSLDLDDFRFGSGEEIALAQNIIWGVEALQKNYPRYLQYAKWVAIREAVNLIEGKRKGKGFRKPQEQDDHGFVAPEIAPPPDMGRLMQEEWDRHFARYRKPARTVSADTQLAQFLRGLNDKLQQEIGRQRQPPDKPDGTIPADVNGKSAKGVMTPEARALWNTLINRPPPDKTASDKDNSSP